MPDLLTGSDRVEGTHHDLAGPRAVRVFGELVLEEFGVGQNDPELIVQQVKEFREVTV